MAEANVLLRIGSKMGPGGLASLKAGWDMLRGFANTAQEAMKNLDEFSTVLRRVDMDMVNYADSAAKGQIDTFELMKAQQQFVQAGAKVTSEQFKILAVRATEMSQATGKDATEAFKQLATSISKGTSRALRDYGIYLTEGGDITETQTKAVKAMTEGYEDLTVELDTSTQKIYGMSNAIDTALGVAWEAASVQGSVFDEILVAITDHANDFVTTMTAFSASEKDYIFSIEAIGDAFSMLTADVLDALYSIKQISDLENWIRSKLGMDPMNYTDGMFGDAERSRVAERMSEINVGVEEAAARRKAAGELGAAGPKKKKRGRGGKRGAGDDGEGGLSFYGYGMDPSTYYMGADPMSPEELMEAEERELAKLGYGGPDVASGKDWESASGNVDDMVAEQLEIEAQIVEQKKIWIEELKEAQAEAARAYAEQWNKALRSVTLAIDASRSSVTLMKNTFELATMVAVKGGSSVSKAAKAMQVAESVATGTMAVVQAALEASRAIQAGAMRQYGKMVAHIAAAASFTSTAALAYAKAGQGGGASAPAGARTYGTANSSETPSYGGGVGGGSYYGNENRETRHVIYLRDDSGTQMFNMTKEGNRQARNAGESGTFQEAS